MWGDWAAACCFYADIGTVAQKSIRWKVFTKHSLVLYTFGCTISIGYMWRHWCSMAWLSILGRKVTHAYSMVACRTFIHTDGILMPITNAFWYCNRQKQTEQTILFSVSTPFVLFGFRFILSLCVVARSVTVSTVDGSLFYMDLYIR